MSQSNFVTFVSPFYSNLTASIKFSDLINNKKQMSKLTREEQLKIYKSVMGCLRLYTDEYLKSNFNQNCCDDVALFHIVGSILRKGPLTAIINGENVLLYI